MSSISINKPTRDQILNGIDQDAEAKIIAAMRATGLMGCGCCASDIEDVARDSCPSDDGYIEHTYKDNCIKHVGSDAVIARFILAALA